MKAFIFIAEEPSLFRTVRLYRPVGTPLSGNVQRILELVRLVIVPASVVLPLVSEVVTPERNDVPDIVTGVLLELYPEAGVMEVMEGVKFVTVKAPGRVDTCPSGFRRVQLYDRVGAPVRVNVHEIEVLFWYDTDPGILMVELVSVAVTPLLISIPLMMTVVFPIFGLEFGVTAVTVRFGTFSKTWILAFP